MTAVFVVAAERQGRFRAILGQNSPLQRTIQAGQKFQLHVKHCIKEI